MGDSEKTQLCMALAQNLWSFCRADKKKMTIPNWALVSGAVWSAGLHLN